MTESLQSFFGAQLQGDVHTIDGRVGMIVSKYARWLHARWRGVTQEYAHTRRLNHDWPVQQLAQALSELSIVSRFSRIASHFINGRCGKQASKSAQRLLKPAARRSLQASLPRRP